MITTPAPAASPARPGAARLRPSDLAVLASIGLATRKLRAGHVLVLRVLWRSERRSLPLASEVATYSVSRWNSLSRLQLSGW